MSNQTDPIPQIEACVFDLAGDAAVWANAESRALWRGESQVAIRTIAIGPVPDGYLATIEYEVWP